MVSSANLKEKEKIIGRSLLVVAHGVYLISSEDLVAFESKFHFDIKEQTSGILKAVLQRSNISAELFDVALEGLSYIWLKFPTLIEKESSIFKLVLSSL